MLERIYSAKTGFVEEREIPDPPAPTAEELLAAERSRMVCSPLQGQLALGETEWAKVEALLADTETPWATKVSITRAIEWKRNSQLIDELAYFMDYTPEQVDSLFRLAMTIEV